MFFYCSFADKKHFTDFFGSFYFSRVVINTFLISFWSLVFGFPAPILLALMFNEIRGRVYKRVTQTISYLPYFVSLVVICSLIKDFTAERGPIGQLAILLGGPPQSLISNAKNFYAIYVGSHIWQYLGFGSIIYLAAISMVDMELYDAALIDGAGRFRRIWSVTLPAIIPTIVIMLILTLGSIMNVGYEKIILLYTASIYETSDVISTFVYRKGLIEANPSYATAVGLFNSVINCVFLFVANWVCGHVSENSLW